LHSESNDESASALELTASFNLTRSLGIFAISSAIIGNCSKLYMSKFIRKPRLKHTSVMKMIRLVVEHYRHILCNALRTPGL